MGSEIQRRAIWAGCPRTWLGLLPLLLPLPDLVEPGTGMDSVCGPEKGNPEGPQWAAPSAPLQAAGPEPTRDFRLRGLVGRAQRDTSSDSTVMTTAEGSKLTSAAGRCVDLQPHHPSEMWLPEVPGPLSWFKPARPLPCCVTLSKPLHLSGPQFPSVEEA